MIVLYILWCFLKQKKNNVHVLHIIKHIPLFTKKTGTATDGHSFLCSILGCDFTQTDFILGHFFQSQPPYLRV